MSTSTSAARCSRGRAKLLPLLVGLRSETDATSPEGNQPSPRRVPPAQDPGAARAPTQPPRTRDHDRPAATPDEEVTSSDT